MPPRAGANASRFCTIRGRNVGQESVRSSNTKSSSLAASSRASQNPPKFTLKKSAYGEFSILSTAQYWIINASFLYFCDKSHRSTTRDETAT